LSEHALIVVGLLLLAGCATTPESAKKKLASSDPATRAKAADFLRNAYAKDPLALGDHGEQYWAERLKKLPNSDPNEESRLLPGAKLDQGGEGGGGGHSEHYRLDSFWYTTVWRSDRGDGRIYFADPPRRLVEHVEAEPPRDFSGVWNQYYVNGVLFDAVDYEHGKPKHELEYHDNGQVRVERTWNAGGIDGRVVRRFTDGGTEWDDTYASGKQVGVSLWYWDNGKVRQEGHFKDGKLDGTMKNFSESGNETSCIAYRAGEIVDAGCDVSR
jgi:antitoxin component YwqK of YwqJK toxin-antitoxin module